MSQELPPTPSRSKCANAGHYVEKLEGFSTLAINQLLATQQRLEAAEKERDEVKQFLAESMDDEASPVDGEYSRLYSKYQEWKTRAETAEAKLARIEEAATKDLPPEPEIILKIVYLAQGGAQ